MADLVADDYDVPADTGVVDIEVVVQATADTKAIAVFAECADIGNPAAGVLAAQHVGDSTVDACTVVPPIVPELFNPLIAICPPANTHVIPD